MDCSVSGIGTVLFGLAAVCGDAALGLFVVIFIIIAVVDVKPVQRLNLIKPQALT